MFSKSEFDVKHKSAADDNITDRPTASKPSAIPKKLKSSFHRCHASPTSTHRTPVTTKAAPTTWPQPVESPTMKRKIAGELDSRTTHANLETGTDIPKSPSRKGFESKKFEVLERFIVSLLKLFFGEPEHPVRIRLLRSPITLMYLNS